MKSDMVISISLVPNARSDIKEPLIIGALMDNIEIVADKLKFAVSNAKTEQVSASSERFILIVKQICIAYASSKYIQQDTKHIF
jgi:hypothetical protein